MKIAKRFEDLPPYTPIEPFEILSKKIGIPIKDIIKLDANENPYGPSPRATTAISNLQYPHIYPDPESRLLRKSLSEYTKAPFENLIAGSGADELIDLLLRVFLEPGDNVINCPPTFGMYSFDTLINAGNVINIPRDEDFKLNIDEIEKVVHQYKPKLIFITSPNNPDGKVVDINIIKRLLKLPVLTVLDEAYIEFAGNNNDLGSSISLINQVKNYNNLIVLRTFSKWAGLAGLRVGYGAFPDWLLPTLWKVKQPYNINVAASAAAIASLDDLDWLKSNIEKIKLERSRLFEKLLDFPLLSPYPSQSNFILCKVSSIEANELKTLLSQKGIFVRHYNTRLLKNYIRISVGTKSQTDKLMETLENLISERDLL